MFLKSPSLTNLFLKQGYVKVALLSKDEVNTLNDFYFKKYPKPQQGFHSTHFLKDSALKKEVHQKIVASVNPALEESLEGFELLFSNFMIKPIGENNRMPLHADWTYVDERSHFSMGLWCPLVDTNEENGMLGVVPKSHLLKRNNRGPKIPSPFNEYNEYIIENYGELIPLKAGEAILYDHRLLHFSPPNHSSQERVAMNVVVVPRDIQKMHFSNLGNYPKVAFYEDTNTSFYLAYDHFEKPSMGKAEEVLSPVEDFSKEYIISILRERQSFMVSIKSFFS